METTEKKLKRKGWFKVGHVFFDSYAKHIGANAALTYLFIKGYEHMKTRRAWPSETTIAEGLDLSRRTISRATKTLRAHRFIYITKEKSRSAWPHNVYNLTQSCEWLSTPSKEEYSGETNMTSPRDIKGEISETQSHIKKNNRKTIKETLSEEQGENSSKNFELINDMNQLKEKMNLKF